VLPTDDRIVAVVSAAGLGKTALLAKFASDALAVGSFITLVFALLM